MIGGAIMTVNFGHGLIINKVIHNLVRVNLEYKTIYIPIFFFFNHVNSHTFLIGKTITIHVGGWR